MCTEHKDINHYKYELGAVQLLRSFHAKDKIVFVENVEQYSDEMLQDVVYALMNAIEYSFGDILKNKERCVILRGELVRLLYATNIHNAQVTRPQRFSVHCAILFFLELTNMLLVSLHEFPSEIVGIKSTSKDYSLIKMHIKMSLSEIGLFKLAYLL